MTRLDPDHCYAAVQSRDRRFDGWFVTAVRTTGIYCRPSCPAITPKRANVDFFPTAATAQQRGFRACKRCRPDASPGSPEWNARQDVVGRAMRLIADGAVERDGVSGLATRLGYSARHLNRLLTDELGAGPLAIARAQRAHTARLLIETTAMTLTDVAFAAGFGSVRQFNDTIREVFAAAPGELRRAAGPATSAASPATGEVRLRLATRPPFAGGDVLAFLGARAIPGLESWDGVEYRRAMTLPNGHGVVSLTAGDDHVVARVRLAAWSDLSTAVQRVRRLLDLDADPQAVDDALAADRTLRRRVRLTPGRRSPASVDPYETAVRAIVGQQVSVAGARTVAARLVAAVGDHLAIADDELTHVFPAPDRLAAAPDDAFSMPAARAATIRRLAAAIVDGAVRLDPGVDPVEARAELIQLAGVGPWTADYVVMRGLGHPDTFLPTDLGVVHALAALGLAPDDARRWAPWRSYAVHHLWAALPDRSSPPSSAPSPAPSPATGARPGRKGLAMTTMPSTTTSTTTSTTRSTTASTSTPAAATGPTAATVMPSPVGPLTLVASERGLRAVSWHDGADGADGAAVGDQADGDRDVGVEADHPILAAATRQLGEYFAGERTEFDVPLDPVGTPFQMSAWTALRSIPYGETISYGEQAERMGDKRKARAVGAANGKNPLSIVVPCHRVVGADGSLTGFAGGVETKAWLLAHERATSGSALALG